MKMQKVIVFIFVVILLIYMIRMARFTKRRWEFKTYAFGILISGLSVLLLGTFTDMISAIIYFEYEHVFIRICFLIGVIVFTIGVMVWSSYTKRMIEMFEEVSLTDHMTGVYNRNGIERIFANLIEDCNPFFVMVCDLNKTKKINDSYGHVYGDEYIKNAATIMKNAVKLKGYLGRTGGDEFIILMDYVDENYLNKRIDEIKMNVSDIFPDNEIGVSIGYSVYPEHGENLNELILLADKRMYEDKLNN